MLDEIAVFIDVVELQSFSRAAEKRETPVPVISRQIARLEKKLNTKLLHRSTRRLSLTEAGSILYEGCKDIPEQAENSINAALDINHEAKGTLRISCGIASLYSLIAPQLPNFLKTYPNIKLTIIANNRVVNLLEEGFDLAIRAGLPNKNPTLISRKLMELDEIVCASPAYLKKHGAPKQPKDLLEHNCFSLIHTAHETTWHFHCKGKTEKVTVQGSVQMNTGRELVSLAKEGLGIIMLPSFVMREELKSGELIPILQTYCTTKKELVGIIPDNRHIPFKTRVFLDYMTEALKTI
jgi:DNA-binding transcriptional LysR family regulator